MRLSLSRVAATALTATTLAASVFVTGFAAPAQAAPLAPGSSLPGTAAPQPWLGSTPFIVSKKHVNGNHWKVRVWSPANRAVVDNNVLLPPGDQPRPSFYLLPGIKGGQAGLNWMSHSDVKSWFANENVNVVMPLGGPYSPYTDWDSTEPAATPSAAYPPRAPRRSTSQAITRAALLLRPRIPAAPFVPAPTAAQSPQP
ncbi:hypothetical protein [Corynebacterium phoceense]|uniref:hypothetical protein n=1 Tax=Corynebacterium phoceense TaxID=1686286 RepID=UPI00215D4DBE|nr:hypothetical protein [Corynebacterium phoceense]